LTRVKERRILPPHPTIRDGGVLTILQDIEEVYR